MAFSTLLAGSDIELSYVDSGAPASSHTYTTVVAIHGMCFSNLIFEKLLLAAPTKGARIVALNRRHYPGSSEYSAEELSIVLNGGSEEQKDAELQARGVEIGIFINNLIVRENIPPINEDGKTGGIILLGWSLGSAMALATIANADVLSDEVRTRLGAYIRSVIAYDPAPIVLGLPTPKQNWSPLLDTYIPENLRLAAFGQWAMGYYDHTDLSKRDLDTLSFVLPSGRHISTFFNISAEFLAKASCYGNDGFSDLPYMIHFVNQFKASYRKVLNNVETHKVFPALKAFLLFGENTNGFAIAGMWAAEDDQKEAGWSDILRIRLIPGINHFWHWDHPEDALNGFLECVV